MSQPFVPQLAVPAFFTRQHKGDFARLRKSAPAVAFIVLDLDVWNNNRLDPNDPGDQGTIQNWQRTIKGYQLDGMKVLGYVPTFDGKQGPGQQTADIQHWIDLWYTIFNVRFDPTVAPVQPDGIFFDMGPFPAVVPVTTDVKQFYTDIYRHAKGKPGAATVMLNAAGYNADDGWWIMEDKPGSQFRACDIAQLVEDTWDNYLNRYAPGKWWTKYPPERIMHTIHHCACVRASSADPCTPPTSKDPQALDMAESISMMKRAIALSRRRKAGYVYVFDDGGPVGGTTTYGYLAQYWKEELTAIQTGDENGGGGGGGSTENCKLQRTRCRARCRATCKHPDEPDPSGCLAACLAECEEQFFNCTHPEKPQRRSERGSKTVK